MIMIAVPSNDHWYSHMAVDLCMLVADCGMRRIDIMVINPQYAVIHHGRNNAVDLAIKYNASHLLFIDSDMRFPADALWTLLRHDKDIVGVDARRRRHPFTPVIGKLLSGLPINYQKGGLKKVAYVGGAFSLVKTDVYKQLKPPYYLADQGGEDVFFCNRAREAGRDIWCDVGLSMKIGHIGTKTYYLGDKP